MISPTDKIHASMYARTTSVRQIKPNIEVIQQLEYLSAYAQRRSHHLTGGGCDAGISGSKWSLPDLAVVMDGAASAQPFFDILLVFNCTRLARNSVLQQELMSRLGATGIRIEFPASGPSSHQEEKSLAKLLTDCRWHVGGQDDRN